MFQDRPIVIASNRGPVSYVEADGRLTVRRGGGGLVSGLAPLLDDGRARWIAAALSDADREAVRSGLTGGDTTGGDTTGGDAAAVTLLDIDETDMDRYYDVVSNSTLWFVHHGLFDLVRSPAYDDQWWDAWAAYERVNERFAAAVCETAPQGAAVLVQDYHLTLLAPTVRAERPDLSLVHFHHTPFAGPDGLRVLPPRARAQMLASLDAHHACGFHVDPWVENFADSRRRWPGPDNGPASARLFASTLSSDPDELRRTLGSEECRSAMVDLDEMVGEQRLIVRVDRLELSKNIARGFAAFDLLLSQRPDLRGNVTFLACCYPSREGVAQYARYREDVERAAAAVNERWGDAEWQPVRLETDDDYPRSVAALSRYDVLLVNPVRDGLNLVAKEGPLVNDNDGLLVLSTEAGAYSELAQHCSGIDPFDLSDTAAALGAALDTAPEQRSARSAALRRAAGERTPQDWLHDQLNAAGEAD